MTSLRSRFTIAGAALLLVGATLSGCSSSADLQQATAAQLQSGVLDVTTAAAAGDYASAQSALDALQADLLAAAAAGQVTAARSAEIQSAINLVSDDLASATVASTPTPTPTPTAAPGPGKDNGGDKGKCKNDNCDKSGD